MLAREFNERTLPFGESHVDHTLDALGDMSSVTAGNISTVSSFPNAKRMPIFKSYGVSMFDLVSNSMISLMSCLE